MDNEANLLSALYASGTLDIPSTLGPAEISSCETSDPESCSYATDLAEPEVGIMQDVTWCETHGTEISCTNRTDNPNN